VSAASFLRRAGATAAISMVAVIAMSMAWFYVVPYMLEADIPGTISDLGEASGEAISAVGDTLADSLPPQPTVPERGTQSDDRRDPASPLEVTLDRSVYGYGDTITAEVVQPEPSAGRVHVKITGVGGTVYRGTSVPSDDGTSVVSVDVGPTWRMGDYALRVDGFQEGPVHDSATFSVVYGGQSVSDIPSGIHAPGGQAGAVTRIVDGDTIDVDGVRIRLALVDTPERGESGYTEAVSFTRNSCPVGSTAVYHADDGQTAGSYGRIIAKVWCLAYNTDGASLNEMLADRGHADILKRFCKTSEFGSDDWAERHGC